MKPTRITATMRVAIGLAFIAATVLMFAISLGVCPDTMQERLRGRLALCETIAISASNQARQDETRRMEDTLRAIVLRNDDIVSAAIRRHTGYLTAEIGDHQLHWDADAAGKGSATCILVPIIASNKEPWGSIEIRFQELSQIGWEWLTNHPYTRLMFLFPAAFLLLSFFYLKLMLRHMDPSKSVPSRVRGALNTITSGLLVIGPDGRIVLANQAFADAVNQQPGDLQGVLASTLEFHLTDQDTDQTHDWMNVDQSTDATSSVMLTTNDEVDPKTFLATSAAIQDEHGEHRGILVSFEDVTVLKAKEQELEQMLRELSKSREEIRLQNEELRELATKDPLTSCFNRRAFFESFEKEWSRSNRYGHALSCVMVDIDFFKSINDNYGHSVGDLVLKRVAEALRTTVRDADIVCRYGGEEFCVVLPHTDHQQAVLASERLREAISKVVVVEGLNITASLGTSAKDLGAAHPQGVIEQADKALYVAKRSGRNQTVSFADVDENVEVDESQISRTTPIENAQEVAVPFHAVTALTSALGFRDPGTADHSRRVADLCVAVGSKLMSIADCYVLETAALLHDIGKIGVPDAILLKPGPLTREEWEVMSVHDEFGVEIVSSAFNSPELTEIIRTHHAFYGAEARHEDLPQGKDIPLGARILTIADAYDAMTSDRCYRKGQPPEKAFAELRRCSGTQFDPDIVDVFIETVEKINQDVTDQTMSVSKSTALRIGVQIERLSTAIDQSNTDQLHALAGRLKLTAMNDGVGQIADLAQQLEAATSKDAETAEVVQLTGELLKMCRETQRAFLNNSPELRTMIPEAEKV